MTKIILGASTVVSLILTFFGLQQPPPPSNEPTASAISQYGMPGIYNSSSLALANGSGVALAVDSAGQLILSTTTEVTASFPSLTDNGVVFATSSGELATSSSFSWDDLIGLLTTKKLIATASSSFRDGVQVAGALNASGTLQIAGTTPGEFLFSSSTVQSTSTLKQVPNGAINIGLIGDTGFTKRGLQLNNGPIELRGDSNGGLNVINTGAGVTGVLRFSSFQDDVFFDNRTDGDFFFRTNTDVAAFTALTIKETNGFLGVNTTNPANRLEVAGGSLRVGHQSAGASSTLAGNFLVVASSTANNEGLFLVDSSGNVSVSGTLRTHGLSTLTGLISTASSSFADGVQVAGALNASGTFQVASSSVLQGRVRIGSVAQALGLANQLFVQKSTDTTGQVSLNDAALPVQLSTSNNAGNTEAYYAVNSGNGSSYAALFGLAENNAAFGDAVVVRSVQVGHTIQFIVDSTNRMLTIDNNDVAIGVTAGFNAGKMSVDSSGNITTSSSLQVSTSSTLGSTISTTTIPALIIPGSLRIPRLSAAPAGINPVCVDAEGNAFVGGSSICPLSSLESKENLKPISYGLKEVLKTNFYDFTLKKGDGRVHSGPIADFTNKYMPNLTEWRNGQINGFDYLSMIGVQGQAIKELKAEKDAEIAALRKEIELLKLKK